MLGSNTRKTIGKHMEQIIGKKIVRATQADPLWSPKTIQIGAWQTRLALAYSFGATGAQWHSV